MGLMEIHHQAEAHPGTHRAHYHSVGGRLVEVKAEVVTDIETGQMGIHRGIDDIQPPEKNKEKNGLILILPVLIAVAAEGLIIAGLQKGP